MAHHLTFQLRRIIAITQIGQLAQDRPSIRQCLHCGGHHTAHRPRMIPAKGHSSQVTPKDETHLLSVRSYDWLAICATETESSAKRSSCTSSITYSSALQMMRVFTCLCIHTTDRLRYNSAIVPLLLFGFTFPSLVFMLTSSNRVLTERLCCTNEQFVKSFTCHRNSHH